MLEFVEQMASGTIDALTHDMFTPRVKELQAQWGGY